MGIFFFINITRHLIYIPYTCININIPVVLPRWFPCQRKHIRCFSLRVMDNLHFIILIQLLYGTIVHCIIRGGVARLSAVTYVYPKITI
jgi:hypothetical protein